MKKLQRKIGIFSFNIHPLMLTLSNLMQQLDCPLAWREAPAEGRRPKGEGANIDWRLVPYHAKCMRIQSRIEFIYIYIYICINYCPFCDGVRRLGTGQTFEESNNKSFVKAARVDRNQIQSDEKKVEYSKAWVNET